jgi:GH18 family chitinase
MWALPSPRRLAVLATLLASALPTMALVAERAPTPQMSIGFFDSWGYSRPCAAMTAKQVDYSKYTHLLWAFLQITPDLNLDLGDNNQWNDYLAIPNVKKLVSLGGDKADKFLREALQKDTNGFVDKIVDFFNKNKALDGMDIDWEFPREKSDYDLYLNFVRRLRSKLPGKILSVDLPVYDSVRDWPLKDMIKEVDFFIIMTYGYYSYRYGGSGASDGCPRGDCIRSHMDIKKVTETWSYATKDTGVPTNKFVLGIANYGNGFVLANAACTDPRDISCTYFMGQAPSQSKCTPDLPGMLTLNEINGIVKDNKPGTRSWYDVDSDSNFLVRSNPKAEWYGYMDERTMAGRKQKYASWGAAGTAEWTLTMR